jgi:DNA-binding CsgD family transcriptional regulator/tetratricopeptide (TPR) repeat protein
MTDNRLELAGTAYTQMAWRDAFALFTAVDETSPLGPDDLDRAARTAQLLGRTSDADRLWLRAVHGYEQAGDRERAARCAHELGMSFMQRGDMAQAGGWHARAMRLVGDGVAESAIAGYLLIPVALQALFGGDPLLARPTFLKALEIGERFGDTDLTTLGRLGVGQSLLQLGQFAEGLASLDDAMVSVTAGEVSPLVAGIVYCAGIEVCHALFDLRRARAWTDAFSRWCAAQPDLVPFRGQYLTHRAEMIKFDGSWTEALEEVQRACERLMEPPPHPALGEALYQKAELHRLRGEFAEAEAAYRATSESGRDPQPGFALLRVAQGQLASAETTIRRVVAENHNPVERPRLLLAFAEIMLAAEDTTAARAAADELAEIAAVLRSGFLDAAAAYAAGAVALADGDAQAAIRPLRRACTLCCEFDTPYDAARARLLIGLACRELGDEDSATMEFDMARAAFAKLGAAPDLARLDALTAPIERRPSGGLTGREIQVLELIAAGKTNRQIAGELFISEKTVARHVSNIFTKVAVSSRAGATAYAYQHGLA